MLIIPPLFKLKLQSDNLYWKVFVVVICVCWYQFEMFLSKSNWEASKSGECTRITRPTKRKTNATCWTVMLDSWWSVVPTTTQQKWPSANWTSKLLDLNNIAPSGHQISLKLQPWQIFIQLRYCYEKNPLTLHHTGCLVGILIIAYYPHITGQYSIISSPKNTLDMFLFFSLLSCVYYQTVTAVAKIGDSPRQLLCLIFSIDNIPIGGHH